MSGMSVGSYSTLSSRKGQLGLASGMESEEIIEKLTASTNSQITSKLQKKQVELWKQSAYQEITTKMTDFYDKYFQYSGGNSNTIMSDKFFDVATIDSSASQYVTATGDTSTAGRLKIKDIESMATTANFTSTHKVSNNAMSTGTILENWQVNSLAGAKICFNLDGKKYTASIDEDFEFSDAAIETVDGKLTDTAKEAQKNEIIEALNNAINANDDIKDKIKSEVTEDGKVKFTALNGTSSISIDGSTSSCLSALGISSTATTGTGKVTANDAYDPDKLFDLKDLRNTLAGTKLTVTLDSVSKTIEFKESEKDQYASAEGLATYIGNALNSTFGENRVFTSFEGGQIKFSTTKDNGDGTFSGNASSIFTINNSDSSGITGKKGALRVISGESNRTEYIKTLDDLAGDFSTPLTADADGKYSISVNGKVFSFEGNTMLGDVITKISSDSEAGVDISYSSVTDTFSVNADETGAHGKIDIADNNGSNLASVLFGAKDSDYSVTEGTDFKASMSFDNGNTYVDVTRSNNSFTIDDLTLTFKGKAEGTAEENITFSTEDNTDKLYDKIKEFVDGYNEIGEWINTKINESLYGRTSTDDDDVYLPLTDEQRKEMSDSQIEDWEKKAKTGLLRNDDYLFQIQVNLRNAMSEYVESAGLSLDSIGISTSSDYTDGGKLYIDEDKLKSAISTNINGIKNLFADTDNGIAYKLQTVLKDSAVGNASGDGLLVRVAGKPGRTNGDSFMDDRISDLTTQLSNLKTKLNTEEDRLWKQFSSLESYISNMNSQSSWLTSYFGGSNS